MDNEIRKRLRWVQLYEELGNGGGMPEMRHFPAYASQVVEAVSRARIGWSAREEPAAKKLTQSKDFSRTRTAHC
jgi:hypothetical protein